MTQIVERKADPSPPLSPRRDGTAGDAVYRSWRSRAVRTLLALVGLALAFGFGVWYGLGKGAAGPGTVADHSHAAAEAGDQILYWTCSMHPQIKLPDPGKCPICFMDLIPVRAGEEAVDPNAPRLALSERARQLARVETSPVELRNVSLDVRMVGKVMPDETAITQVSSYIPGRLDRLYVDYTGILVRKGDHLAEIYSPELLVAQREYLLGLEAIERAGRAGGSEAEKSTASALLEAAQRKLELWGIPKDQIEALARHRRPSDHMRIDAPLEGWVIERYGYEGMYVETGTKLFTLADLRNVWVMLDAYELDIGYVRLGQEVEFETEAFTGQVFKGQVAYVDPVLNPSTRTVKVRLNVANPDLKLRPEMFVRARLKAHLGEGGMVVEQALAGKWICPMHPEVVKDAPGQCDKCGMDLVKAETLGYVSTGAAPDKLLTVPRTAVLLTGKRAVVYVEQKKDDGTPVYEGRVVKLGPRAGDYYVVESGLQEGERVVTRGALMIDSALQIMAKPSMMQPAGDAVLKDEPAQMPSHYVAGAAYHQHAAPVIDAYLKLTAELARSDAGKSAEAVAQMRSVITRVEPQGLAEDEAKLFRRQLEKLSVALPKGDKPALAAIRESLPGMTAALQEYLTVFGHNQPEPLVRHYCSMAFDNKGAGWLQADHDTLNPYFGEEMLRCGVIELTIGSDGSVKNE